MANPCRFRKKLLLGVGVSPVLLVKVVICQDQGKKRKNVVVPSAVGNACDGISAEKDAPQQGQNKAGRAVEISELPTT